MRSKRKELKKSFLAAAAAWNSMSSHKNLNMTLLRAFVSFIAKRKGGAWMSKWIVGYSALILQSWLTLNQLAFQCTSLQILNVGISVSSEIAERLSVLSLSSEAWLRVVSLVCHKYSGRDGDSGLTLFCVVAFHIVVCLYVCVLSFSEGFFSYMDYQASKERSWCFFYYIKHTHTVV